MSATKEKLHMETKQEIKLEDIFNDEKRQGVKELIDKHKQEAALKEALLELRKTPMTFEPEQETLEKYSERFDNDKSEIGNPDTWGKRVKQETLEEAAKGYSERHQDVSGNLGKYLVSAVFQDGAEWQQEQDKNKYSEEEVLDMMFELLNQKREECCITHTRDSIVRKVFEKFKKK